MSAEEIVRAMVEGKPLPEKTLYDLCWREYKDCLPEIVEVQHNEGLMREGKQKVIVIFKIEGERYFRVYYEKTWDWDRTLYTYPEQVAVEVEPKVASRFIYYVNKEKI